jgi:hypothetical protein
MLRALEGDSSKMIRARSGFNTWVDLFADATREWFYRKIDGEPIHHTRTAPASASANSEEALSGARLVHQNLSQTREIFADDLSQAQSHALQATLRLLGCKEDHPPSQLIQADRADPQTSA